MLRTEHAMASSKPRLTADVQKYAHARGGALQARCVPPWLLSLWSCPLMDGCDAATQNGEEQLVCAALHNCWRTG